MPDKPKLLAPDWTKFLPIAELFHANGYATASIGKWQLGGEAYYPGKHGFDVNIAAKKYPRGAPDTGDGHRRQEFFLSGPARLW